MGGISVASALGQPLKADIELVAVNKTEKAGLVARLASPDAYKSAGLEYPYGNKFKFQIEGRANGELYIKVSSSQPVNDPFVSMLIELTWASGKLLREYTFLLDPPDYVAEQPKQAEVQAVAPAVQSVPLETAAKPAEQAAPVAAAPVESQPAEKPAGKPAATVLAEKGVATGNITVQRGDTLNKIAAQNKPAEVSLERMLVALYRANAKQFDGKNMNRIRAGKILRLPDQSELMSVAQSDAAKEIRAQTADWNAYRQKLAGAASSATQPQEARQVAAGKIASSVADKAPVAKESAKEVLKLSKGEAPGDKAAAGATGGKPISAKDKKIAEQEDAIAKAKSLKEEQARAALLEKNLKDMQHLAQLKSEAAALAQQSSGAASAASGVKGAASAVAAASSVAAASAVKPAPVAKPKPKPQPVVVPEPSLVDQILGEPLYLAGGAAILLGLGGIGFMLSRRKRSAATAEKKSEETDAITRRITTPVVSSPETGDFTSAPAIRAEAAPQQDEVDPISEADLFLNFGRDAQAEEILKDALRNTPNNHQIHLKLLGIYANRKDVNSFSSIARQLKDSGDEEAWQQAAAMGGKLEPNNPMYGGARTLEDTGSATMQTTAFNATPDFVLDDTAAQESSAPDVDFDLGGATKMPAMPAAQTGAMDFDVSQAGTMDFDVSSTQPSRNAAADADFDITSISTAMPAATGQAETALPNLDDLVFDVTSTRASMPAAQPEADKPSKAAQAEDAGMEFTLDFPVEKPAQATQVVDTGLADISLNLDDIAAPGEPAVKDEHWHEVATKLDLAKAYQEMGDATGAREILDEVLREGDDGQRETAQAMLDQLG